MLRLVQELLDGDSLDKQVTTQAILTTTRPGRSSTEGLFVHAAVHREVAT